MPNVYVRPATRLSIVVLKGTKSPSRYTELLRLRSPRTQALPVQSLMGAVVPLSRFAHCSSLVPIAGARGACAITCGTNKTSSASATKKQPGHLPECAAARGAAPHPPAALRSAGLEPGGSGGGGCAGFSVIPQPLPFLPQQRKRGRCGLKAR